MLHELIQGYNKALSLYWQEGKSQGLAKQTGLSSRKFLPKSKNGSENSRNIPAFEINLYFYQCPDLSLLKGLPIEAIFYQRQICKFPGKKMLQVVKSGKHTEERVSQRAHSPPRLPQQCQNESWEEVSN